VPDPCTGSVAGLCCPAAVADPKSALTLAYLQLKADLDAHNCKVNCPQTPCQPVKLTCQVTDGGSGTCH
jgi:hypothetical protein